MIFTKTSRGNFTKAQPRTEPCRYHSLGFGHDQGNQKVIRNTFDIMLSIGYKARDETFSPRSAVNTSTGPLGCEWNRFLLKMSRLRRRASRVGQVDLVDLRGFKSNSVDFFLLAPSKL